MACLFSRKFLSICLLPVLFVVGCTPAAPVNTPTVQATDNVTITISGSGTVTGLMSALQAQFEADTPGYKLNVLSGTNTGAGVEGALQGVVDVAAMASAPSQEAIDKGLQFFSIGGSGVAIFAHSNMTVASLTPQQLADVFTGEINNWSEVGGPDEPIIIFVRPADESPTKSMQADILGEKSFSESAALLQSSGDMLVSVAGSPGGVGYGSWTAARTSSAEVKAIAVDGVMPSENGYLMSLDLGLGYTKDREPLVKPFLDWLASEKGRAALIALGVILAE